VSPGLRAPADLDPGRSLSHAATTKAAQEYLVAAWARQNGGAAWALRYHKVYRPRMPRHTRTRHRVDLPGRRFSAATRPRVRGRGPAPRLPPSPTSPRAAEMGRARPLEEPAPPTRRSSTVRSSQLSRHRAEQAAAGAAENDLGSGELDEAGTGVYGSCAPLSRCRWSGLGGDQRLGRAVRRAAGVAVFGRSATRGRRG
jgi:hypothetical protein